MENTVENKTEKIKWKCPNCGATENKHGKGGKDTCWSWRGHTECGGFLCDCDDDGGTKDHGLTEDSVCEYARCYHCDWIGRMPPEKLDSTKLKGWQAKAWKAGWRPANG